MKTIGIIGGLGPLATVYCMELIVRMTDAGIDQEHPKMLLESIPATPDRTSYILGESQENPLPMLIKAGKELSDMGVDFITIPCVTAQYFYEDLIKELPVPVLALCGNVAEEIAEKNIKKVGILATTGTIQSGVLEDSFNKVGVATVMPDKNNQDKVMDIIYGQVKQGKPVQLQMFREVVDALTQEGAERIVLGCTELSLLKREMDLGNEFVDVLEVLAQKTVLASGASLKEEYRDIVK